MFCATLTAFPLSHAPIWVAVDLSEVVQPFAFYRCPDFSDSPPVKYPETRGPAGENLPPMIQIHGTVATERKKARQRFTFEFVRAGDGKRLVCVGAVGFQREFPNPVLGDKIRISGEIYGEEVYASTVEILPWNTTFEEFSAAIASKELAQPLPIRLDDHPGVLSQNISEAVEEVERDVVGG